MKTERADVGADSLQWLKEHGIRRLAVDDDYKLVDADGVRAFCFGGSETEDKAAPNRSMYLQEANLSFEFLQQLAQVCLYARVVCSFVLKNSWLPSITDSAGLGFGASSMISMLKTRIEINGNFSLFAPLSRFFHQKLLARSSEQRNIFSSTLQRV